MKFTLQIWRQEGPDKPGRMETFQVDDIVESMSILETIDHLNENLIRQGKRPVEFDSDCREGICGTCGLVINGVAHGPKAACTTCELRMRSFRNGETITIEPFRARSFPVVKDLIVDRSAFDRIISKGGYVSVNAGSAPEANSIPVPKVQQELAMDAAACIGCGACVAACPNASASLFLSAKISQLAHLPQGQAERRERVMKMVDQADVEGFGDCSNHGECEAVCPKEISILNIAQMRRDYWRAALYG
jgi:succinate dehydrogenase / fumarate reductase iron-sulfur subunit